MDVSDIFNFLCLGEWKGEFEAPGGGGFVLLLKIPGGRGGGLRGEGGGGVRRREGVCGEFLGGGANFFLGAESPTKFPNYVITLFLRFRGPGRRSLGARSQKVSEKSRKKSPGAGPQKSEKSLEKGPKGQKSLKMGFGDFSDLFRDFLRTFGTPGLSRLFRDFGPETPSPRSTEPQFFTLQSWFRIISRLCNSLRCCKTYHLDIGLHHIIVFDFLKDFTGYVSSFSHVRIGLN